MKDYRSLWHNNIHEVEYLDKNARERYGISRIFLTCLVENVKTTKATTVFSSTKEQMLSFLADLSMHSTANPIQQYILELVWKTKIEIKIHFHH